MLSSKRRFAYNLPFKTYSARKRNGQTTVDFPYHNIPEQFNPNIRIVRFDQIWKVAKLWCQENGFSWTSNGVESLAPA